MVFISHPNNWMNPVQRIRYLPETVLIYGSHYGTLASLKH